MKRDKVLEKAGEYINGDRAKDYGDAYDNFTRIAEGWNLIIKEAQTTHGHVTARHVALMLDWLKTARLLHNLDSTDGWIDKVGYSALGCECSEREDDINQRLKLFMENHNG